MDSQESKLHRFPPTDISILPELIKLENIELNLSLDSKV
jgi:hypothetical protein